ncbi:MAG: hypothetical protein K1X79_12380 [Oligoflexia bacterium]|nr:hypothetical protein [Oligoflexia bacterium]
MSGWKEVEHLKQEIGFAALEGSARKWWLTFEAENNERAGLVLRLLQELKDRKVGINDFFLAYVYSEVDNIQTNLDYLDMALQVVGDRRPLVAEDFANLRQ